MKRTERSVVLGANWRLANAKSSMVHENNRDAACMDEMERTERKSSVQPDPLRITAAINKLLKVNDCILCRPGRFRLLRSF